MSWPSHKEGVDRASEAFFSSIFSEIETLVGKRLERAEVETVAREVNAKEALEESALAVATTNQTKSGEPTVDSVKVPVGKIVLLTAQAGEGKDNGPWVVESGAWVRPTDFAHGAEKLGVFIPVIEGLTYAGSIWVLKNSSKVVVDTSPQTWKANEAGSGVGSTLTGLTTGSGGTPVQETVLLGVGAGTNLKGTSRQNYALGYYALHAAAEGVEFNVAIGGGALTAAVSGAFNNIAIGAETLVRCTTGNSNVGVGTNVMLKLTTGTVNTAVGNTALEQQTTGSKATAIGAGAGFAARAGAFVAIGYEAMGGSVWTAAGGQAGEGGVWKVGSTYALNELVVEKTGGQEQQIYKSLKASNVGHKPSTEATWWEAIPGGIEDTPKVSATAEGTVAIGSFALNRLEAGARNLAIGELALEKLTSANDNAAVGYRAGYKTTGSENTLLGSEAGKELEGGSGNTLIGYKAGEEIGAAAAKNVYLGGRAGIKGTGSKNIFIGWAAGQTNTESSALVIGGEGTEANAWIRGAEGGKKLGFFGVTPVARKKITAEASAKALIEYLKELGITE